MKKTQIQQDLKHFQHCYLTSLLYILSVDFILSYQQHKITYMQHLKHVHIIAIPLKQVQNRPITQE